MRLTRRHDPLTTARLKRAARCPDCHSQVRITSTRGTTQRAEVRHDDSCPTYNGRGWLPRVAVALNPGQDPAEAVTALASLAQTLNADGTATRMRLARTTEQDHETPRRNSD